MKVLVLGGSGLIGMKVVRLLREQGHEAEPGSRSNGVDVITGVGLDEALAGKDAVVDVTNPAPADLAEPTAFFTTATRHALEAETRAGVRHHVVLSIIGTERIEQQGSYLAAKSAQEEAVRAGSVPFTILRATQFFEFLPVIADIATTGETVTLPMTLLQPVAADDVAQAVVDAVIAGPTNGVLELAGPGREPMADLIRRVLNEQGDQRRVIADDRATYLGMAVGPTSLVPLGEVATAPTTLERWLANGSQPRGSQERTNK